MVPYIDRLFHRLVAIIQAPNIPPSLTENAAITVGRLGLGCCEELAPHLATFAELFLHTLAKVQETDEKDTAFRGFVLTAGRNPQALEDCLKPFFQAIARYRHPSKQLHALFLDVSIPLALCIISIGHLGLTLNSAGYPRLPDCHYGLARIRWHPFRRRPAEASCKL